MGIPHLITNLQPFAVDKSLSESHVVIDGPSLAYHIYFICLRAQRSPRNPFEASPSYDLFGEVAIKWLDELQSHGAVVKKIYFDGFLPPSKLDIRLSRLTHYTRQLLAYHGTCPHAIPSANDPEASVNYHSTLFSNSAVSSRLASLPALPFIVPAIIEKLNESVSYRQVTDVIPGEADSFCALYLRKHGGIVITSDSDLLVHDLGAYSSVCFLKDISLVDGGSGKVLSAPHYNSSYIIERLGFKTGQGLLAFAFEISKEPHFTLPQLRQRVKDLESAVGKPKEFNDFIDQYGQSPVDIERDNFTGNDCFQSGTAQILKGLDPRISEFVLQCPSIAKKAGIRELNPDGVIGSPRSVSVFLPFLLDNPIRTSAWDLTTPVRQLAYGLINLVLPVNERIATVSEYRRRENNSQGREWQLPTLDEIFGACAAHLEILRNIRRHLPDSSNTKIWRVFATFQEMVHAQGSGKASLAVTLSSLPSPTYSSTIAWDEVQFSAQIQGFYYSWRIVKQILAVVYCFEASSTLAKPIHDLKLQLDTLPALSKLPSFSQDIEHQRSKMLEKDVQIVRLVLDTDVSSLPLKSKVKEKSTKSAKRRVEQITDVSSLRKTNNMFDILNME